MSMSLSRRVLLAASALSLVRPRRSLAAEPATAVIGHFYDELLAVMKQAKQLSFDERYKRLAPAIERTFDLGLMTRISIGPSWSQIAANQQQRLTAAFSRYTISMYANRFDGYGGERFEVSPASAANANGVLVNSKLVKSDGDSVTLNYLMRQGPDGAWRVIDVYLSGTISELATRRSEFLTVLQRDGADGLVRLIENRIAALRAG